eukprot:scaffold9786_cov60-Isochrysis_galbana.AAC.2
MESPSAARREPPPAPLPAPGLVTLSPSLSGHCQSLSSPASPSRHQPAGGGGRHNSRPSLAPYSGEMFSRVRTARTPSRSCSSTVAPRDSPRIAKPPPAHPDDNAKPPPPESPPLKPPPLVRGAPRLAWEIPAGGVCAWPSVLRDTSGARLENGRPVWDAAKAASRH